MSEHRSAAERSASAVLTDELIKKVRSLGILVWVDAEGQYTGLADELARGAPGFEYPVVGLRGSYLELMFALEKYGSGLYPEKVLVHLPGLNKETIKETPVYELFKAGKVFEKGLATLVREAAMGVATPDEVETFLKAPNFSLRTADEWLASLRAVPRDRLTLLLESIGRDNVVLELVGGSQRFEGELPEAGEQLLAFLGKELGLTPAWRAYRLREAPLNAHNAATLVASWLMAVEFVHDLRGTPVTPELQPLAKLGPIAAECRRLVARLREQNPDTYELYEHEFQGQLEQERKSHSAQALGSIDTFRFEETAMRKAAIDSLQSGDWELGDSIATARTPEQCFWVKRSPALGRTWELLRRAAQLGKALASSRHALKGCGSLQEAAERYAGRLAPVDRQHRELEQRAHAVLASDLEDYDALLEVRSALRQAYRDWANAVNRAFHDLCVAQGVLPDRSLRQRAIYEDIVHPMLLPGSKVAYVMVDALRFEMALALEEELRKSKFVVTLKPRLAELPTITAVGMNALAPAEQDGRLKLAMSGGKIEGLITSEFKITDPESRARAISLRSLGAPALLLELEEFQDLTLTQLKKKISAKPDLILVRSQELDTAGEHKLHLGTFEQTLSLLKSAISLLQQAGVEHFVIASDHGFLLQDSAGESYELGKNKRVPERRHALLPAPSGASDVLEIKLSALEYDVADDQYLVLRPDTALWKVKDKIAPFVHGGNSLQERVIPVLILQRQGTRGKTTSRYEVVARAEPAYLGRQRLRISVRLQHNETREMSFASPKTISLALRVHENRELAVTLLNAEPPAKLAHGQLIVTPNREDALVEFEITGGEIDEKVQIQVYHPDGVEDVAHKVVEGFFEAPRDRRLGKPKPADEAPPSVRVPAAQSWAAQILEEDFRRACVHLADRRTINEQELVVLLGTPRRVRAFSRAFDELMKLLPFEVEIMTLQGMKAYARRD